MSFYTKELKALEKANRLRDRRLFDHNIIDLASNDYLGLSENQTIFERAVEQVRSFSSHSPKASQLVNGYHPIHQAFERYLCELNDFEDALVVGSGFLANMALIEALVRKGDHLIMDEHYHASGRVSTKLVDGEVSYFDHNSAEHLEKILQESKGKRIIIAVEGIYSMHGDQVTRAIFDLADHYNAILIVDEAHSSGVVGKQLLGVFESLEITPKLNHIKMGTLGKAYGSYGAYIMASEAIIRFLINRAKSVIYTTAPSLMDIALAHQSLIFMQENATSLSQQVYQRETLLTQLSGKRQQGLIAPIEVGNNQKVVHIQEDLLNENILVGAIRQPTVDQAIIRLIARINIKDDVIKKAWNAINL
jgi:8-amino-7-oxononanoate synthase